MIRVTPEDKLTSWRASGDWPRLLPLTTPASGSITRAIRFARPCPEVQSEVKNTGGSERWASVADGVAYGGWGRVRATRPCFFFGLMSLINSRAARGPTPLLFPPPSRVTRRDHTGIDPPSCPHAGPAPQLTHRGLLIPSPSAALSPVPPPASISPCSPGLLHSPSVVWRALA